MGKTNFIDRVVSGKGVILCPPSSVGYRYQSLSCEVIRDATGSYRSYRYSPEKGQFANICFMKDGYVINQVRMEFLKQRFVSYPDVTGEILLALRCAQYSELRSFYNTDKLITGSAILQNNPIKDFAPLDFGWDEALVDCFADCAIALHLFTEDYDSCVVVGEENLPPSPPPHSPPLPPPVPKVDVGVPLPSVGQNSLSVPYDGKNDNGKSIPNPLDVAPPLPPNPNFPLGKPCQRIDIKVEIKFNAQAGGQPTIYPIGIYGEFSGSVEVDNLYSAGGFSIGVKIECRGIERCSELRFYHYEAKAGSDGTPGLYAVESVRLLEAVLVP